MLVVSNGSLDCFIIPPGGCADGADGADGTFNGTITSVVVSNGSLDCDDGADGADGTITDEDDLVDNF